MSQSLIMVYHIVLTPRYKYLRLYTWLCIRQILISEHDDLFSIDIFGDWSIILWYITFFFWTVVEHFHTAHNIRLLSTYTCNFVWVFGRVLAVHASIDIFNILIWASVELFALNITMVRNLCLFLRITDWNCVWGLVLTFNRYTVHKKSPWNIGTIFCQTSTIQKCMQTYIYL